jgi:Mg-chelatase subunit ChlD
MNIETILSRPTVRGFQFRLGLESFAHKAAQSLDLGRVEVVWAKDVQTAGINSNNKLFLSGVKDEAVIDRALVLKYAGYVVHELLHSKYTNFGVHGANQYIRTLHNAVEDGWIENTGIQSGLLGNIAPLLGELIDTMSRQALAEVSDWNNPAQYPYLLAVHCRKHATVKLPVNPRLLPIFDEAARRCAIATSSVDTLQIAEWVYAQIKQESEKPTEPPPTDTPPTDTPPNPPDGPVGPSNDEGEGDGTDEGEKPPREGEKPPSGPVKSPVDIEAREVEPKLDEGGSMGNYSADADVKDSRHCTGGKVEVSDAPIPAKLRYEVKRLFDNSGITEFSRNRKFGSVNVHALPTVATGNDRVFKRRLDIEGIDSAVVIVLDISGSMFASTDPAKHRAVPAVQACRALLETLTAAGVKVAVLGFGSYVFELKTFDANHRKASTLLGTLKPAGGTNDYTALRYAHQMLIKRQENRKLAFVITDGRGNEEGVRQQVASGNAFGVTTIGIGIKSDIADIYGNAVTISRAEDIGSVSFKQIKLAA